ncbi:hypothetical protein CAEBREN_20531 [Caenorhabditis brenneri]|uniref:Uncharacterized protein n=1 Tax=Caenorhabditis brenneri TaxID=135651 RepID=G0P3A6_CAEBE|nr:hypothetical protein CAEBREN_20531 [Caenorhabditis brenneri]
MPVDRNLFGFFVQRPTPCSLAFPENVS